jgi:hypothetical protein
MTIKNNKRIGYSPIRVEKIEEVKKILEISNLEERKNRNHLENIYLSLST